MSFRPRDAVYHDVRKRIVLNQLKPGEALTELGLARLLGCSQGPVREALLKLQQDGLVIRAANRSTTVTTLEPEAAAEIVELRKRIERRGAQKAVSAVDSAAISGLEGLLADMREAAAAGDEYRLIERDTAFHMALFALANLQALEPILLRCIIHSHRQKLWAPGHRRPLAETAERHQPILAALAARDGERLETLIAHHIDTIVDSEAVAHHPQKWTPGLREG